jgi:hypothetical protein
VLNQVRQNPSSADVLKAVRTFLPRFRKAIEKYNRKSRGDLSCQPFGPKNGKAVPRDAVRKLLVFCV